MSSGMFRGGFCAVGEVCIKGGPRSSDVSTPLVLRSCEAQPWQSFCCLTPVLRVQGTPEPGSETPSPPCRGAAAVPAAGTLGRRSSTGWWPCPTATTSPPSSSWTPPRCRRRIPSSHGRAAGLGGGGEAGCWGKGGAGVSLWGQDTLGVTQQDTVLLAGIPT